jgi:Tol biopolymer transport system component
MTDHDADQVARWLGLGPDRGPTDPLEATFARLRTVRQRPAWLVGLRGGTIAAHPADPRLRLALAVAVVVLAIVGGGLIATSGVGLPDPSAAVQPSPLASASPSAATDPTPSPAVASQVIVFTETRDLVKGEEDCTVRHCRKTWVAMVDADGTGQRRLFPDAPPVQSVRAVAPDGSRMIVQGLNEGEDLLLNPPYLLTDLRGSEPTLLDLQCELPCVAWIGQFAFSPDGTRIAFVRTITGVEGGPESSAVAVMDLASGQVTVLESTVASNPDLGQPCHTGCGDGDTEDPRWSPDGHQVLFSRSRVGLANQPRTILDTVLFVVDVDGANLRQLVATELFARDAQGSPDGSLIAFTSAIETLTRDESGRLQNWHQLNDIYTVRPDGSDLRRLTSFTAGPVPAPPGDLGARFPAWTRDGDIVFNRRVADPANPEDSAADWEFWVIASDGTGGSSLGTPDAAMLSELGCVECAYPVPDWGDPIVFGFWRPNP